MGDADIGEHSNIGASSVFVNYDGETKRRTVIGSHVKTGSDTMFVAPVTVGDGAYTGAGTVIREDVPPGALAVSAGRQRNIEGWVAQKRPARTRPRPPRKHPRVPDRREPRLDISRSNSGNPSRSSGKGPYHYPDGRYPIRPIQSPRYDPNQED